MTRPETPDFRPFMWDEFDDAAGYEPIADKDDSATRYRLKCAPDADTFASATEAVCFAIRWGLKMDWEACE